MRLEPISGYDAHVACPHCRKSPHKFNLARNLELNLGRNLGRCDQGLSDWKDFFGLMGFLRVSGPPMIQWASRMWLSGPKMGQQTFATLQVSFFLYDHEFTFI